jgi:hypothetical protein
MMPDQPNVDVFSGDRPLEQDLRSILKELRCVKKGFSEFHSLCICSVYFGDITVILSLLGFLFTTEILASAAHRESKVEAFLTH